MLQKSPPLYVRVEAVKDEAIDIRSYRLAALDGGELPEFKAGAHIGIVMPSRITRYYSLCSAPSDRHHYAIAVQKVHNGRGGSRLVHDLIKPGKILKLHRPRNFFELEQGSAHLLVAGGIGITPIRAMIAELDLKGQPFHLIYCVKSRAHLPFADEIDVLVACGQATLHIDVESNSPFDFKKAFAAPQANEHLYCCGSPGFMAAVKDAAPHWRRDHVHFESFAPVTANATDFSFEVLAAKTDRRIEVAADQSILAALRENGIDPDSVCENGTCGTCKTRYLSGEPDHRDHVLSQDEQSREIMICVSRVKRLGDTLVLDL